METQIKMIWIRSQIFLFSHPTGVRLCGPGPHFNFKYRDGFHPYLLRNESFTSSSDFFISRLWISEARNGFRIIWALGEGVNKICEVLHYICERKKSWSGFWDEGNQCQQKNEDWVWPWRKDRNMEMKMERHKMDRKKTGEEEQYLPLKYPTSLEDKIQRK